MEAKQLVDTFVDTEAELEVETLGDTLGDVETKEVAEKEDNTLTTSRRES